MDKKVQWAISYMLDKLKPDFFGDIVITFQEGKPIKIRTETVETLPKDLRD